MKSYDEMTLRERVGQLICFGFFGTEAGEWAERAMRDYHLGNVIIFARNFESAPQLFKLTRSLHSMALKYIGVPLFVSVDQEGGPVTRFTSDLTWFPGAMATAATGDPESAYRVGDGLGSEMEAFGVNYDLAPVVNLSNNPRNPHIGSRGYSGNPDKVAQYACRFVDGMQRHAVATMKHFPSIGSGGVDLHLELGRNERSLEQLYENELAAVRKSIARGVKSIMISHEIYPAIDDKPGTLSKKLITDILRGEYGYDGLVISDAMEMKALDDYCGVPEGCVRAVEAGIDLLLICHDEQMQHDAYNALYEAAKSGRLSEERLRDAVERILRIKAQYPIDKFMTTPMEELWPEELRRRNVQTAAEISRRSLTLYKNDGFFPLSGKDRALFISPLPATLTIADELVHDCSVHACVGELYPEAVSEIMDVRPSEQDIERLADMAKNYEKVVLFTYNAHLFTQQLSLLDRLTQTGVPVGVVAMRNPFDAARFGNVNAALLAYEYTPVSLSAVFDFLQGKCGAPGVCPVEY